MANFNGRTRDPGFTFGLAQVKVSQGKPGSCLEEAAVLSPRAKVECALLKSLVT